jgi:hypothetical protein
LNIEHLGHHFGTSWALAKFEACVNSEHLSIMFFQVFFGYFPNFEVRVNIEHFGHHFGTSWALMVNL